MDRFCPSMPACKPRGAISTTPEWEPTEQIIRGAGVHQSYRGRTSVDQDGQGNVMRDVGDPGRAVRNAIVTVVSSLILGLVLTFAVEATLVATIAAIPTGLLIPTVAALSVLRRVPATVTSADQITLLRGVLAGGCATLVVLSLMGEIPSRSWPLFLLAVPAFMLDGVDGWVARKTGTASAVGGRLDMETDAAFFLVLSIALSPVVGGWVLGIGAMRYLFWLAARWRPALRLSLAFSHFRRTTAGVQGAVLVGVLLPVVPTGVATVAAALALTLLCISFGKDIVTLEVSHSRSVEDTSAWSHAEW